MSGQAVLLPGLCAPDLALPGRRKGLGWLCAAVALGLHGLALAGTLILAQDSADYANFPAYEVELVSFGQGQGTGHEEGAPAAQARVASVLPKRVEAPAAQTVAKPAARPAPAKPAPAPAAVPDPAAWEEAAPPAAEAPDGGQGGTAPGQGAAEAAGDPGGHVEGLPQGQGQGLGQGGYGVGQVERPPRLLRKVEPRYPLSARQREISGKVLVKFLVDHTGHVCHVSVVESQPEGYFEQSAIQAVSRWQFSPGVLHGRAVSVWMLLPITFALK